MSAQQSSVEIAVIGAGSVGIAVAYYLSRKHGYRDIVIIDPRDPMSLTSAQSGENYRNWWPHPVMTAFTNDSIALMEDIARESGNRINMSRRGYTLITRRTQPDDLIEDLYRGYGSDAQSLIRLHSGAGPQASYKAPTSASWEEAPEGVDVLQDKRLIQQVFPAYSDDVGTILHVRRAGAISGQQLGQFMLEHIKTNGGRLIRAEVTAIEADPTFKLIIKTPDGVSSIVADKIVNAAGPYLKDIAAMVGESIDVSRAICRSPSTSTANRCPGPMKNAKYWQRILSRPV